MDVVSSLYFAEIRNITVLTRVMLLAKVNKRPFKKAFFIMGIVMLVNTFLLDAPNTLAASSIDGSI